MRTNKLRLFPVLMLLLSGLLAACSQETGVENPETPKLPDIIPDEPTQIDIHKTSLPIIENFGAADAEAFFSPAYKSLATPASNDIKDDDGNTFTLTDPWPSFYYPTCCFFRTDSGTGELIRTPPFSSSLSARFRIADNKLQISNARFSIGQILSDLTSPSIPERKSDTTADPRGASIKLGSWGELDLTRPYRVSFCLNDFGSQGTGDSNIELWVDNNSGGRSTESIHSIRSLLMRAAITGDGRVVEAGRRIVADIPGEAYMVNNSGKRIGPTLGVIQPLSEPDFPVGTFSSFLQMRISSGGYAVISDLVIEYQSDNNTSGMTCAADPVFYVPPYPFNLDLIPGDSKLDISWDASSGATGYDIAYNTTDSLSGATIVPVNNANATSQTITGLTNGTTYFVFIRARYAAENSDYSPSESAVVNPPPVPPATPSILNLNPGNASIDVVWSTDGTATSYDVAYNTTNPTVPAGNPGDTLAGSVNVATTGTNLTGLTNGTTYYVFVRANNNVGSSDYTASMSGAPSAAATWTSIDVGAASGTTLENTSAVTITGQGQTSDTGQVFRYVYTPINGDFTFTARLDSFDFGGLTTTTARIGLLLSPSVTSIPTDNTMQFGAAFYRGNGTHVRSQRLITTGTASGTSTVTPGGSGQFYIRLQRTGNTVRAAFSRDGGATFAISNATGAYSPALPDTVYVGFHVNAGTTTTGTATFSDVSIVGANGSTVLVGPNEFAASSGTAPDAPAAPTLTPGDAAIGVTWGGVFGATGYDVIYNTSDSTSGATTFASNIGGTSTTITGLSNGTTYYVFVRAKNAFGDSAYSPSASAAPVLPPPAAPAAPSLTPGDTTIGVTWGGVSGATGYDVIYNTSDSTSGATTFASNIASTSTTITGLSNGTAYYVFVRAKNSAGDSAYSPSSSATPTQSPPAAPAAPTLTPGNTTIGATWSAVSGATGYDVIYNTSDSTSGATTFVSNIAGTSTTITGLTNGTTYYVFVRAKNGAGDSGYSLSSSAIPVPPAPSTPAAPTLTPGDTTISATWGAVSGATGYDVIYNTTDSTSGATTFASNIAGTSTTITGLTNGTTYYVFVRAKNLGGDSAYSSSASATAGAPQTPAGLTLIPGANEIAVSWTAPATGVAPTGYDIAYNTSNSSDPNANDSLSGTMLDVATTNTTLTGLTNDETYFVFVRAKTASGASAYTASKAATPLPATPWTALNLDAITGATIPGTAPSGTIDASTPTSITITATGGALSSDSHRLFFAYRPLAKSSITITARVASIAVNTAGTGTPVASTNNFRFGMMLTDKINTSVATYADVGSWGDIGFYYNATPALVGSRGNMKEDNTRTRSDVAGLAIGNYIRIEIFDDTTNKRIRRFTSTDGVTFTQANSTTDFQADSVDDSWYWGFYGAPGADNTVTIIFDDIRVTSP